MHARIHETPFSFRLCKTTSTKQEFISYNLRSSLTRWIRFDFALVNDFRFEGFNFLNVHLMRLSCFCELGENETTTAQDWAIHLKHLWDHKTEEEKIKAGLTDSQDFAYCNICNSTDIKRTYCTETLNPSSCAQAYTAAVLPTPGGPIMSTVLHSSCSWSIDTVSSSKSPQSHDSTGKEICTHISQFQELKKKYRLTYVISFIVITITACVLCWQFHYHCYFLSSSSFLLVVFSSPQCLLLFSILSTSCHWRN